MKHTPLSKQRSDWTEEQTRAGDIGGTFCRSFWRRVGDGTLWAIVGLEPRGWHLSISFRNTRNEATRYPSWDEQVHACRALLPHDLTYVMALPAEGLPYVAWHATTFHWHQLTAETHLEYEPE